MAGRKAIQSFRLRLHSGLRQHGKGLSFDAYPRAAPQAGICRAGHKYTSLTQVTRAFYDRVQKLMHPERVIASDDSGSNPMVY